MTLSLFIQSIHIKEIQRN